MSLDAPVRGATGPYAPRHAVDAPSAIFAAAFLIALNQIVPNIQPLVLGALAQDYGLSDRQLGHVSAAYVGSITVCTVTAPLWIRHVNWRTFCFVAALLCVAVFAWGATLRSASMFLFLFMLLGLTKGAFGAPAFASLGDSSNPDRAYGLSAVLQGLTAAAIAAPVSSFIVPKYGVSGLFVFLGLLYATGLLAARWMPSAGRVQPMTREESRAAPLISRAAIPALVGALALVLFTGAVQAFWFFVERIGTARGVPGDLIGLTISVTALSSIGTSALNTWLGGRLPTLAFIAAGTALILGSYAVLIAPGNVPFIVCNLLFALGWGFAQPAYWAILRQVDGTERLFVIAPAASGAAGVIIGILAGPVIERGGYGGLLIFSGALSLAGVAIALGAVRLRAAR